MTMTGSVVAMWKKYVEVKSSFGDDILKGEETAFREGWVACSEGFDAAVKELKVWIDNSDYPDLQKIMICSKIDKLFGVRK